MADRRRRCRLRPLVLLWALLPLAGCERVYFQDISAAQYFPDPAYGAGRRAFQPRPGGYAPPVTPLMVAP